MFISWFVVDFANIISSLFLSLYLYLDLPIFCLSALSSSQGLTLLSPLSPNPRCTPRRRAEAGVLGGSSSNPGAGSGRRCSRPRRPPGTHSRRGGSPGSAEEEAGALQADGARVSASLPPSLPSAPLRRGSSPGAPPLQPAPSAPPQPPPQPSTKQPGRRGRRTTKLSPEPALVS